MSNDGIMLYLDLNIGKKIHFSWRHNDVFPLKLVTLCVFFSVEFSGYSDEGVVHSAQ